MTEAIVYIGGFSLPNRNASAIRVRENAWLLKSLGYEVVIIGKLEQSLGHEYVTETKVDGFQCFDIFKPFNNKSYSLYTRAIDSVVDVINYLGIDNVKALIAYNYSASSLNKLNKFLRNNSIIPIADCTEWYGWEGWRVDRNIRRYIDTQYRMRVVAKRVGNIICAGSFLENFFKGENTVIWPFCVNTQLERWRIPEDIVVGEVRQFVYSGSPGVGMSKDKVNLLIQGFYELKLRSENFCFKILGITKEQYLKYFKSHQALLKKLDDSVIFLGRVPHEQAFSILSDSDFSIFIRPYNRVSHAGFPTKVMEAFTAGIPTITNATSDIVKYIINKKNGLIIEGLRGTDIVNTLQQALNMSKEELGDMKQRCRSENPFLIKHFSDKVKKFLDHAK